MYLLEPWGEDWKRTAAQMAMYANSKARKGVMYEPDDFIPYREVKDTAKYKRRKDAIRRYKKLKEAERKRRGKQAHAR